MTLLDTFLTFKLIFKQSMLFTCAFYSQGARAHMSQKDHQERKWFKVAILEIETTGFLLRSSFVLNLLI